MILTAVLSLLLLLAVFLFFVISSALLGFLLTRVPFVRTYTDDIKFFTDRLNLSPKDVFYDLGCGDGKVCFLVNQLTGAQCVGFELVWWTYLLAQLKLKVKSEKLKIYPVKSAKGGTAAQLFNGVKFRNQNFFKHSWAEAGYIYGYLFPPLMSKVEEKFLADCKPGTIAIIRDFPFPNLRPICIYKMPKQHLIYIYRA